MRQNSGRGREGGYVSPARHHPELGCQLPGPKARREMRTPTIVWGSPFLQKVVGGWEQRGRGPLGLKVAPCLGLVLSWWMGIPGGRKSRSVPVVKWLWVVNAKLLCHLRFLVPGYSRGPHLSAIPGPRPVLGV